MARLRDTARISSLTEGVLGRLDRTGEGRERSRAVNAWRAVAGDEVFAHARGFALRDAELLVFVDAAVWANELMMLSEHYRTAVNERLGKEVVGSIRFAVSKRVDEETRVEAEDGPTGSHAPEDQAPPVPLSDTERQQITQMAAAMKNEKLREAVVAAATAHLAWRKGIEARNAAEKAVQRATEGTKEPRG